ncbi:MAG: cupin domain-containing protein [Pseudomonadota bacterium]
MAETNTYHLLGCILRFLARSPDTGGAYSLVEARVAPGAGAPPNTHPEDDESFYVVDGRFEFLLGGETVKAGPGDFVKVPTGAAHAFTNVGEASGMLMIVNTPGVIHDAFFSQAGEPLPEGTTEFPEAGPPDVARLSEIAARCGLRLGVPAG